MSCQRLLAPAPWTAPNWPGPAATVESRRTAIRVARGATSLSNSSHFPPMPLELAGALQTHVNH